MKNRKIFIGIIITILSLGALIFIPDIFMYSRRYEIYSIILDLKPGMNRNDIIEIINREKEKIPNVTIIYKKDGTIFAFVPVGLMTYCHLAIGFYPSGFLKYAKIYGENGPYDKFNDAPADIEVSNEYSSKTSVDIGVGVGEQRVPGKDKD